MVLKMLEAFLPRNQPWITRQSYTHELISSMTQPLGVSLVEGAVVGVLAKRAFEVSSFQFAFIMAAPAFANLTSFLWARLARGRRKVRFITALQITMQLVIASIALLPTSPPGSMVLVTLVVLTRCLLAGVITLRSVIWRHNYPRRIRAQVTGRLTLVTSLVMTIAPLVGFAMLDRSPKAFRIVYPAATLLASVGAVAFSRVRLRRESELLRYETSSGVRPQPHGAPAAIYEYDPKEPQPGFWSVLRRDRFYRRYLLFQFVLGGSAMMGETVTIYLVVDMAKDLGYGYLTTIAMTMAIPMWVATCTLPWWARYLDRVHVVRFRAIHSGLFWLTHLIVWLGAMRHSLLLIALARVISGVVSGGSVLAWNLGHNDFADRRMVALYMGINATLTGVRGAIFPFLSMLLFIGWAPLRVDGIAWQVPHFDGIGPHIFVVTAVMALCSSIGFRVLDRAMIDAAPL